MVHRPASAFPALSPVFDLEILETCEVSCIDRDEHESASIGDSGNLAINVRGWPTEILKACPFPAMPRRGSIIIRENRERGLDHLRQVSFKGGSSFPLGKAMAAIGKFVPDRRRYGRLMSVLLKPFQDLQIRFSGDWGRDGARIQEISKGHNETLRPGPLSRAAWKKSASIPTSSGAYFRRKFL